MFSLYSLGVLEGNLIVTMQPRVFRFLNEYSFVPVTLREKTMLKKHVEICTKRMRHTIDILQGIPPFYCRILLAKGILHITQEEDSLSCLNRNINPFKAATYMIQIYLTSSVSICPAISFPFVRGTLQVASTSISSVIRRLIVCALSCS